MSENVCEGTMSITTIGLGLSVGCDCARGGDVSLGASISGAAGVRVRVRVNMSSFKKYLCLPSH